jgi:hypothetical protein
MRRFVLALCTALVWPTSYVAADEIELFLPQNNVSTRPILEFRARRPSLGSEGRQVSLTGHAYVLLGRELDNGNTLFNHVKGFYPNGKGVAELVNMVYGKGVVKQTLDDAASDIVFGVYITPVQETAILKLFQTWNDKTYSLPVQNCIDFTKAVARATKLTLPPYPSDVSPEFPTTFIVGLSQQMIKIRHYEADAHVIQVHLQHQHRRQLCLLEASTPRAPRRNKRSARWTLSGASYPRTLRGHRQAPSDCDASAATAGAPSFANTADGATCHNTWASLKRSDPHRRGRGARSLLAL